MDYIFFIYRIGEIGTFVSGKLFPRYGNLLKMRMIALFNIFVSYAKLKQFENGLRTQSGKISTLGS